jgi:ERF superfamily
MHRSSENVSAIATALAKAQTELSNPEKAMIGTIYNARSDSSQSFRYASLSSGLDIIRKTLGGQQIAIAQTTDIDRSSSAINLTTVLMHTSGEWIASDWPVCSLSEISQPRRMGAALTYARRYALFTMVGIAGEDDLDSPDIANNEPQRDRVFEVSPNSNPEPALAHSSQRRTVNSAAPAVPEKSGAEESATIRGQLIHEIQTLPQGELQSRAIAILKAKNRLSAEDAKLVEEAFADRMIVQRSFVGCSGDGRTCVRANRSESAATGLGIDGPRQTPKAAPQKAQCRDRASCCAAGTADAKHPRQSPATFNGSSNWHRACQNPKKRACDQRAAPASRQGPPQIRGITAVSGL